MKYREWRKEWKKSWGWREWFWAIYLWPRFFIENLIIRFRIWNKGRKHGDQWWFWTPEWQAKEREANEDIAAGRFKSFDTIEKFLESLDE